MLPYALKTTTQTNYKKDVSVIKINKQSGIKYLCGNYDVTHLMGTTCHWGTITFVKFKESRNER